MEIQVHKFGGSCFRNQESFDKVLGIIEKHASENNLIIAVSAGYGVTDSLINFFQSDFDLDEIEIFIKELLKIHLDFSPNSGETLMKNLHKELGRLKRILIGVIMSEEKSDATFDLISTFGERLLTLVLENRLQGSNPAVLYPEDFICTTAQHKNAVILIKETERKYNTQIDQSNFDILLIPGFYGTHEGRVYTLGRSGTDYTGAIMSYLSNAKSYTIWKDVRGFMSADPNRIEDAETIAKLSFQEAEELSYFGATILHEKTISSLKLRNIPLHIRNLHNPSELTIISSEVVDGVKSISLLTDLSMIKLSLISSQLESELQHILEHLSSNNTEVIAVNTTNTTISVLVGSHISNLLDKRFEITNNVGIIAFVGETAKNQDNLLSILKKLTSEKIIIQQIMFGINDRFSYIVLNNDDIDKANKIIHGVLIG